MTKIIIFLCIIALCFSQLPTCPNGNLASDVYSGKVTLGLGQTPAISNITLANNDLYTYIYSMPLPFRKVPSVAIAISNIQSNYSQTFSYFVKYLNTQNRQNLTFVLKVDHKVSNWTKLVFNFLAETRDDMLTFGYDLSPSRLIIDQQSKTQSWMVPYLESWPNITDTRAAVFINGFDIYSSPAGYPNNSFQIRVINLKVTQNGISLTVNTSSSSQIDKIYLSFIAYSTKSSLQAVPFINLTSLPGQSKYLVSTNGLQLANIVGSSFASADMSKYANLIGFSSFSMQNNPQMQRSYSIDLNPVLGQVLVNTSASNFTLLQNNFLFFKSQDCSGCLGFPLYDTSRNVCVAFCPSNSYVQLGQCKFCPTGTYLSGNICITCGVNQQWNGTLCKCLTGFFKNSQGVCQICPIGTTFVDGKCQCPYVGQTFDETTKSCNCPLLMYVANGKCQQCQIGKYWDGKTCVDVCSRFTNMKWDGSSCVCKDGYSLAALYTCVCTGNIDQSGNCIVCTQPNSIWSGQQCICKTGYQKNLVTGSCVLQTPIAPVLPNYPSYPSYPSYPYYPVYPTNNLITIQGSIMTSINTLSVSLKLSHTPSTLVQNGQCIECSNLFIVRTTLSASFKSSLQFNGLSNIDNLPSFTISLQFDLMPVHNFNIYVMINPIFSNNFSNIDISQPAMRFIDVRTLSTTDKTDKGTNKNVRKDTLN